MIFPVLTTLGEVAGPTLIREIIKIGGKRFIKKYGQDALTSISAGVAGGTVAAKTPQLDLQNEKLLGMPVGSLAGMPKNYTYSDIEEPKKPEPLKVIPGIHVPKTKEQEELEKELKEPPKTYPPKPEDYRLPGFGEGSEPTLGPKITEPPVSPPVETPQLGGFGEGFEKPTWKDYILYSKKDEKSEFKYPTKEEIEKYINEANEFWKEQYKSSNEERPELSPKNLPQIVEADKHFGAAAYAFQKFDNSKLIYISPEDYLSLTTGFRPEEGKEQLGSKMNVENIEKLLKEGKELANIPILYVKKIDIGGSSVFEVDGQEGNHRAKAFKNLGYDKIPVVIEGNTRTHAKEIKDIFPTSIQGRYGGIILTKPEDFYSVISKEKLFVKDITQQTKELVPEKPEFGKLTKTEKQTALALKGDKPDYYSRIIKAIKETKQTKMPYDQWAAIAKKAGSKEELDYLDIKGKDTVSKEDLLYEIGSKDIASNIMVTTIPENDMVSDFEEFSLGYENPGSKKMNVYQIDLPPETSADVEFNLGKQIFQASPSHVKEKYGRNQFLHTRTQVGLGDPDAPPADFGDEAKQLAEKLQNTLIIDEIQSDWLQKLQKEGSAKEWVILKGSDITKEFVDKNYKGKHELVELSSTRKALPPGEAFILDRGKAIYIWDAHQDKMVPYRRIEPDRYYTFSKDRLRTTVADSIEAAEKIKQLGMKP